MVHAEEHPGDVPSPARSRGGRPTVAVLVAVVLGLALAVRVVFAAVAPVPLVHADEADYLGNARQVVSGFGQVGNGNFAGYSLLITPAAAVANEPHTFYELALVTNALLLAVSGVLAVLVVRRLFPGSSQTQMLGAAALVFVYPASFTSASLAMSENAMFLVTLLAAWLLACVAGPDRLTTLSAAGLVAGFAYWVTPRGILVAVAFVVAFLAAMRRRLRPAAAVATLGALGASVAAGHLFNDLLGRGSGTAGLSARETGLFEAVTDPRHWSEIGARLAGRMSYIGVTTLGLAVVGCGAGIAWLAARDVRRAPLNRRLAGGFASLAVTLTLAADALTLDVSGERRPIHYLYYGRYTEAVVIPAITIGFAWLVDRAHGLRRLRVLGPALVGGLLASTLVAHGLTRREHTSPAMTISNVVGLFSLRRVIGGSSITAMLLLGLGVVAAVLLVLSTHKDAGALALLLVFAVASVDVHRHFFETGWAQRSREATLVDVVERLADQGVPTDCIRVSVAGQWWHVNNYRFLLPRSRFEWARTSSARGCGPVLVADRLPDPPPAGDRVVAFEHAAGLALSVSLGDLDPDVRDRLRARGLVARGPVCAPLPDEAYRGTVRVVGRTDPSGSAAGGVRLEVGHRGRGAPWIAGAPVAGVSCGRVRLATEYLSRAGTVVRTDVSDLPRTLFPGDSVLTTAPAARPPGATALRFALVHEGVTWFRDRGAPDLVLPMDASS